MCLIVNVVTLLCVDSFFFFKQKTAYEMRISDWSSDVCSSDLKQLSQLDDRMLADIGINRGDILNVVQGWDGDVTSETVPSEAGESLLKRGLRKWSRSRATAKSSEEHTSELQ